MKINMKTLETENILIWNSPKFYSKLDESIFFEWVKKIDCIDAIKKEDGNFLFYIAADELHDYSLDDLLALFYRYKVPMKQLRRYLTEDNRKWFKDNKIAYWHKKVFGGK